MRELAALLSRDISHIWGEREGCPNGDKKVFLTTGKTFLRALAKDLGLQEYKVSGNPGGIAVCGDCSLIGMWGSSGIYIMISQPTFAKESMVLYRTVQHIRDYSGGTNCYLPRNGLRTMSYKQMLDVFLTLRKDGASYERAA